MINDLKIRQGFRPLDRFGFETNDCVVNAVSTVTDSPYPVVHAYLKAAGRKDKRGFYTYRHFGNSTKVALGHKFTYINLWNTTRRGGMPTAMTFARLYPVGKYLVCTRGHALTVINGTIVDSARAKPRARIRSAWRVEKIGAPTPYTTPVAAPTFAAVAPTAPAPARPTLAMRKVARGHFAATIAVSLKRDDVTRRVLADLEILSGHLIGKRRGEWGWRLSVNSGPTQLFVTGDIENLAAGKALFANPDGPRRNWTWFAGRGWRC
jgi:hypothetical protein